MYRHENDVIVNNNAIDENEASNTSVVNGAPELNEEDVMVVDKASDNSIISVLIETSASIEEVLNHNEEVKIHTYSR